MTNTTPSFPINGKEELVKKLEELNSEKNRKLNKMFYIGIFIAFLGPVLALFFFKVNSLESYIPIVAIFLGITLMVYVVSGFL